MELAEKCGTSMNLLIKDNNFNKITQYHTNDKEMQISNIFQMMGESVDQVSGEAIRIVSVNSNQKSEKAADSKGQSPQIEEASQDSQVVAESLDANEIEQMSNQLSLDNENKKDGDHD